MELINQSLRKLPIGIPDSLYSRQLIKVGADFDKATRNIGQWLIG